jgi:hypothetical protein
MNIYFLIMASLISVFIIYQDMKYKKINLILTLMFVCIISIRYYIYDIPEQLGLNAMFCLLYFLLSYVVLRLYFYIRTGETQKIIDSKIGWGDIILLYAIGCTLEPQKLIFFFTGVFVTSALLHLLIFRKQKNIPLAAYLLIGYNSYTMIAEFVVTWR